jgi:hypothetical protein
MLPMRLGCTGWSSGGIGATAECWWMLRWCDAKSLPAGAWTMGCCAGGWSAVALLVGRRGGPGGRLITALIGATGRGQPPVTNASQRGERARARSIMVYLLLLQCRPHDSPKQGSWSVVSSAPSIKGHRSTKPPNRSRTSIACKYVVLRWPRRPSCPCRPAGGLPGPMVRTGRAGGPRPVAERGRQFCLKGVGEQLMGHPAKADEELGMPHACSHGVFRGGEHNWGMPKRRTHRWFPFRSEVNAA